MIPRWQFIEAARAIVGTPYHPQGRLPGVGLDCSGVIVCAARAVGIALPDVRGYRMVPRKPEDFIGPVESCMQRISPANAKPGDVLVLWIRRPSLPQHFAVLTDRGIVHAYTSVRKVVEQPYGEDWQSRLYGIYRLPQLEPFYLPKPMAIPVDFDAAQERRRIAEGGCCGQTAQEAV